jgi:SAM-dependent methyltransferase
LTATPNSPSRIVDLVRRIYRRGIVLPRIRKQYGSLDLATAFGRIYRERAWGVQKDAPFCSGSGSSGDAAIAYCEFVANFIREHRITSVMDVGCGDFRIGRRISETGVNYLGVDVVPELIEHNRRHYSTDRIDFSCLDVTQEPLPPAELCLVRQVLQHLSNSEIKATLQHLAKYPFAIISEHVPVVTSNPNLDKPHGPDTRMCDGSGVYVDLPPFSRNIVSEWAIEMGPQDGLLRTVVVAG